MCSLPTTQRVRQINILASLDNTQGSFSRVKEFLSGRTHVNVLPLCDLRSVMVLKVKVEHFYE